MLVIRREQMAVFREAQKQRFKARVARALVASHPTELGSMSAGELRSLVDRGVQRAEAYGLDTEASIHQYLEFMAVRGLGFEERSEYAWAGIVLARTDLHADLKLQQLQAIAALLERR